MRALPSFLRLLNRLWTDLLAEVELIGDYGARWRDRFGPLSDPRGAPVPVMPSGETTLFRVEALAARRDVWLGEAQLVQPLPITMVSTLCAVLALSLILFVCFGVYTRRVHADAILAPKTGLITIASPSAGRISTSGALEGETVQKGQLLFTIDVDAVSASGPTQKRVLVQLDAQRASVERQRATRVSVAMVERQALRDQLANMEDQAQGTAKQVDLQRQLTQSLKDRADQLKGALGRGIARAPDVQNQNFLYIEANAQLAQFEQSGLQLKGKISDLQAKLAAFDSNLARELAEMDRQIAQLRQQVAESEAKHAIEIRAPERGVLTSLRVHAGQQVAAGGPLLTVLPSVGNLQANLFVDSSAIGFVAKGEPVMLRYAAFPFQRFGLYRGVVTEVTRAPIDAEDGPRTKEGATGLYRITVKPDRGYVLAYGETRGLEAGMQVAADIALERRPLYRWLLDPVYHLKRSATLVTAGPAP